MSELRLPRVTQASVAKKYGVSTSQVSRPSKKEYLVQDFESRGNHSRKGKREGKEEDVGIALFLWFEQKLGQGTRLSELLLKQKACDLARTIDSRVLSMLVLRELTTLQYTLNNTAEI